MSIAFALVGLVAFLAPILVYRFYFSGKQVLYEGAATCRSYTKTVFEHHRRYALVFVDVPGHGEILTEISHARAMTLSAMTDPVTVRVVKQPFKRAEIESIVFGTFGTDLPEPPAPSYNGLGLSVYFFALAALSLMWAPTHFEGGSVAQHIALFYSALCFAATGFSINVLAMKDSKNDLQQAKAKLLFIPLGSGFVGLYLMWAVAVLLTLVCFWQISILILIPGIHAAFAAGSIPGVLWRNRSSGSTGSEGQAALPLK